MDQDVRAAVRADLDEAVGRMEGLLSDTAARIAREGEANAERLARRLLEMIVRELAARAAGDQPRAGVGSANDVAALVAQAAVRGSRFR